MSDSISPDDTDCKCPFVSVGMHRTNTRCWSEMCPVHGVGTQHFRDMRPVPYGFADVRDMTRDEYITLMEELRRADEACMVDDDDLDEQGDDPAYAPNDPMQCEIVSASKWMILPIPRESRD